MRGKLQRRQLIATDRRLENGGMTLMGTTQQMAGLVFEDVLRTLVFLSASERPQGSGPCGGGLV